MYQGAKSTFQYRQKAISGSARNMLTCTTSRSISVPWLKISLRSSLSKTGFAPSGRSVVRLAGAKSRSGN